MSTTCDKSIGSTQKWLIIIIASISFAIFISPQLAFLGHGLRTFLPLFFAFMGITFLWKGVSVFHLLGAHALPIIAGLTFAITSFMRYLLEPNPNVLQSQVINAIVCIALWVMIIILRVNFPEAIEPVRFISLIFLGVSLGMGIPLLIESPGISRLTMGNPMADVYAAQFFPKGIANYSWYTPVAFAFPVLANWLYKSSLNRLARMLGWVLLLAAAAATLFSTFMMAMVLLIMGVLGWLFIVVLKGKKGSIRVIAMLLLFFILIVFPTIYFYSSTFGPTKYSLQKANNFFSGLFDVGFVDADETGRTVMFIDTMKTFFNYPLFGAWGLAGKYYFIGWHSSWADMLALQGLFGMILWLVFLSPSWKRKHPWSVEKGVAGGTLSWLLLSFGGILNPTLNSSLGLLLLWLYDGRDIWHVHDKNRKETAR
jgi:hypothetical protein